MRVFTRPVALLILLAVAVFGALGATPGSPAKASAHGNPSGVLTLLGSQTSMGSAPSAADVRAALRLPAATRPSTSCANAPTPNDWLTTSGDWVVDSNGCKVRLEGVNWYGMQTQYWVPAGLDFSSYQDTLKMISSLGFNSIRIPMSDQLVKDNDSETVAAKWVTKSPELAGLHPLEVLDMIVAEAQKDGIWVVLDNHDSYAVTKSEIHSEEKTASPTWTAPGGYTEAQWISDWTTLASRYTPNSADDPSATLCGTYGPAANSCGSQPTVIGFDLRNEPHTTTGPWNMKSYLKYGSVWGPCTLALCGKKYLAVWNSESKAKQNGSNWSAAATQAANAILSINPNLLMIIEGTQLYPSVTKSNTSAVDSYWWGSILKGVATNPIVLATPAFNEQIVYSTHEWGVWKFRSPQFYEGSVNYASFVKLFNQQWGFIMHASTPHPIWLGEFNTCNQKESPKPAKKKFFPKIKNAKQCVSDTRKGSQGQWFGFLIKYLQQNPQIGWSYYPFNGHNSLNEPDNNSLQYKSGKVDEYIYKDLQSIQGPPNQ